ncbi:MAG: amidohydrolase family protein [Gammaproteobacteria bacterium]|nr:amidohydrolase family protein [Gammaproteobacteria bacterium]
MALNETREDAATGCHDLLPGHNGIDRLSSLQSFTRNGAKVMRWPTIGTLAQGSLADFVIVDRNPLAVDAEKLAGTQVLRTVLDGQAVFDCGALRGGPMTLPPDAQSLIAESMSAGVAT